MRLKRRWTREWWSGHSSSHRLVTSVAVIDELQVAPPAKRERALELVAPLERFPFTDEIDEIIRDYIGHKLMPADALGDAAHLAFASFHGCDWLLTWNCKHLANANKFDHIRVINRRLGLRSPELITPLALLENEDETTAD